MKTVQSEAEEICIYVDDSCDAKVVAYESFLSGVEFAQRRIPVEEELPDEKNGYINKEVIAFTSDNCVYILIYDNYLGWIPNGTDADIDSITNWRPIELK